MPRPVGGLGRRVVRTPRPASARAWRVAGGRARRRGVAAPCPERFARPLFERIFLQKIVLKCLK
jgi:hypothetical protein